MIRRSLSVSLLCAWSLCPGGLLAPLAAQSGPAATLRLGTWNLEMLGCRKDPPRTDADHQAIADRIRELSVHVLAVQEIGGEQALADLCRRIGKDFKFVLGTTGGWSDGSTRQSIGFVYDGAQVDLLHAEELLAFPREIDGVPIFHRVPVSACFRHRQGGFDFRAITVHFKANDRNAANDAKNEHKRQLETGTLHAFVAGLLADPGEDHDVVVLGDFNHSYEGLAAAAFQRDGVVRYLRPGALSPTIAHFETPIDMVAGTRDFAELLEATLDVHNEQGLADKDAWMRVYSDHFPVTVDVDCARDQDPDATFRRGAPEHALPVDLRPRAAVPAEASRTARPAVDPAAPIPAGREVDVTMLDGSGRRGRLLLPLPRDLQGWIVIEHSGRTIAIAATQVREVAAR